MNSPDYRYALTKENLLDAFPGALRKDEVIDALAQAAAQLLAQRPAELDLLRIYADIDRLPESLLDILAHDFKVDWWNPNYTVEEKRRTLQGSWQVHRRMGTKAAVETAIRAIFPGAQVQEWFQFGGAPYHYRLQLGEATHSFSTDSESEIMRSINFFKRLSAHLDEVTADLTGPMTAYHIHTGGTYAEICGDDIVHAHGDKTLASTGGVLLEVWGHDAVYAPADKTLALTGAALAEFYANDREAAQ